MGNRDDKDDAMMRRKLRRDDFETRLVKRVFLRSRWRG
jgi:hypothetical protein